MVATVGYIAIDSLNEVGDDMKQIKGSSILEVESSTEMAFELNSINGYFQKYIFENGKKASADTAKINIKLNGAFISFEEAMQLRKHITTSGLKLYKGEELEQEKQELNALENLRRQYSSSKNDLIQMLGKSEEERESPEFKLNVKAWEGRFNDLLKGIKLLKSDAEQEISFEVGQMLTESRNSKDLMIVISVLSLIVAIIAGIYITNSIVKPVLHLKEAAENISKGRIDVIDSITSTDEIGDLTQTFNKMALDLKKSKAQIEKYNKTLEQKVNERTKELEKNIRKLTVTEAKLQAYTNNLKVSNLELEQFAYVASHDLQEPLRTTISFAELFRQQYSGKLDDNADKYIGYIVQATNRMNALIKDLLDFSRIGTDTNRRRTDCNMILQDVLADVDKAIKDSGAEIVCGDLPIVIGFATELRQLFQNLIINSIKFRRQNITPKIKIEAQKSGLPWQFAFSDNGIGIDPKHSERIFTIFQRLHTRTEYPGSGIGLSHCKKIVELHHGRIWVESAPGHGSTFYFTIQAHKGKTHESRTSKMRLAGR
jgi:signal transduction histidine kinase